MSLSERKALIYRTADLLRDTNECPPDTPLDIMAEAYRMLWLEASANSRGTVEALREARDWLDRASAWTVDRERHEQLRDAVTRATRATRILGGQ